MSAQNASQSDDRIEKLITLLGQRMNALTRTLQMIAESLQGVELHLHEMSISSNPAPNYRRPLSDYQDFDWGIIGATVLKEDKDGATEVVWNGQVFTRRSPDNNFDAAVFYSRCVGKDSDGKNKYLRLITFKPTSESGSIGAKAKNDAPIVDAPEWFLRLLRAEHKSRANGRAVISGAIPEGHRNDTLMSLAGTMRRRGMGAEEIEAALLVTNNKRCDPPLAEDEVRKIAFSVCRYKPAGEGGFPIKSMRG